MNTYPLIEQSVTLPLLQGWPDSDRAPEATQSSMPRVLLIDDDPMFCKRLQREASRHHVGLTVCKTAEQVLALPKHAAFDVAIIDYFVEGLTAKEIVPLLSRKVPVVLTSITESQEMKAHAWPRNIKSYIHKGRGTAAILAEAVMAARWSSRFRRVDPRRLSDFATPSIAMFLTLVALTIVSFVTQTKTEVPLEPKNPTQAPLRWDQAPVPWAVAKPDAPREITFN